MEIVVADFNSADGYYSGPGADEWADIAAVVGELPLYLQGSGQEGLGGRPIFDPKATNAFLTARAFGRGWKAIPVPADLMAFGVCWDAGKGRTIAEWQFSNYPFLWNNVIRSEAVYKSRVRLAGLEPIEALIVVTKSGLFPSSNSTLSFEQARAQVEAVTTFGTFSIPIRLVGLTLPKSALSATVTWSEYPGRYSRAAHGQEVQEMMIEWRREGKHGAPSARFRKA